MPEIINQQINQTSDYLLKRVFKICNGFCAFFSLYGLFIVALSVFAVIANELEYLRQGQITLNLGLFCLGLILAIFQRAWAWAIFVALLPLLSNFSGQLKAFFGIEIFSLPAPGLDLVGGFFVGAFFILLANFSIGEDRRPKIGITGKFFVYLISIRSKMPWPIGLLLFFISIEVAIAIARNLYQSASLTSIRGVFFNLAHFRPIAWRGDFMPLADLIAYGMAAALIVICLIRLGNCINRAEYLVRPLLLSIGISVLLAVVQSVTSIGLPVDMQFFRMDFLGAAAIGFYPDIHSFAGFTLLGCVGLWAYFARKKQTFEGRLVLLVIALSWLGLLLSKSRSSLLIALLALGIYGLLKAYQLWTPRVFWARLCLGVLVVSAGTSLLLNLFRPDFMLKIVDIAGQIISGNSHYLNSATQQFGGRPELFKAALYMMSAFPWMGIGQGLFYRQSSNEVFSQSFLLSAWGGENAHNYFLQTATETGLFGVVIFAFVILAPLFLVAKKSDLRIGYVALGSLFLGNLYSHSFLVRENLLLGALFLGLLYSYMPSKQQEVNKTHEPTLSAAKKKFFYIFLSLMIGSSLFLGAKEIYKSFGKEPFQYGSECFVNRPITDDGWTSGLFMKHIPMSASEVIIKLDLARADVSFKNPLKYRIEIINKLQETIAFSEGIWTSPIATELRLAREPNILETGARDDSVILKMNGCYVPRDLGVSLDDRLLGVRIHSISFH